MWSALADQPFNTINHKVTLSNMASLATEENKVNKRRKRCPNGYRKNKNGNCVKKEVIDLTMSSDEDEVSTCGMKTTIDKVANAFVDEYAPWKKRGFHRFQEVGENGDDKGKAFTTYLRDIYEDDPDSYYMMVFDQDYEKWRATSENVPLTRAENKKWNRQYYNEKHYRNDHFHTGSKPKRMKRKALKLYVWLKDNKYTITGEAVLMETIFQILPENFKLERGGYVDTISQRRSDKNVSYDYDINPINRIEMRAFQECVNVINKRFKNAMLKTTAPYLDENNKPDKLRQILGWDIEARFPGRVRTYVIPHAKLKPVGHCGPIRERESENSPWIYQYGVHGSSRKLINVILEEVGLAYWNIYTKEIPFYWWNEKVVTDRTLTLLDFLQDDSKVVSIASWGTKANKDFHARTLVKNGTSLIVFDPWMKKSTSDHKEMFTEIQKFFREYTFRSYVDSRDLNFSFDQIDIPAEQSRSEGSCGAVALAKVISIAHCGLNEGQRITPVWVPVLVKMLFNKFSENAVAAQTAAEGGTKLTSLLLKLKL